MEIHGMEEETAGSVLKAHRLQAGLSLEDIAGRTCIRRMYLEAIEENNDREIGDPVYVKGFIRSYAGALGLDGAALVRQYNRSRGRRSGPSGKPAEAGAESRFRDRRRIGRRRRWNRLEWSIVLGLSAVCIGFWIWLLYL